MFCLPFQSCHLGADLRIPYKCDVLMDHLLVHLNKYGIYSNIHNISFKPLFMCVGPTRSGNPY